MGRKPRQHYAGAVYHFIARGNDRQPIFLDDGDRRAFERFLANGVERFGYRSHAYCWMTNHVHMAVEVAGVPLSHIAHNLLFRYARWFHRKHGRSGHLFERRYRAFLIRTDAALQSLVPYIHLNPVRAAIVDKPGKYRWSSYSAYSDPGSPAPSWLTRSFVLSLFGESPAGARAALRAFTELEAGDGVGQRAEPGTRDCEPDHGVHRVLPATGQRALPEPAISSSVTLEEILCAVSAACSLPRSELCANVQQRAVVRARSLASYIVNRASHLAFEELGTATGRDASTLSRASGNIARQLAGNPELQALLEQIEASLGPE